MAALQRASLLLDHRRYEEAAALIRQHLAEQPQDGDAFALLARAQLEIKGQRRDALESVESAIATEADNAYFFALKAHVLSRLDRDREALTAAEEAVRLDPGLGFAQLVKAEALGGLSRWAEAEAAARAALELDPDDENAQNMLAVFLRMQGRIEESVEGTGRRLERDPEDAVAHANSGWAALHSGRRAEAEQHFREALRLDPDSEYARLGLREAFKSRSPLYRLFLRWAFFMQRFTQGQQWAIIIGLYLAFRFGRELLAKVHPLAAFALVAVYLLFCFWSFLASGTGHALMLADRNARLTLTLREKLDGLFVGVFFALGLVLGVLGLTVLPLGFAYLGAALAIGAVPASQVFVNESRAGWAVFGGAAALVYGAGIVGAAIALGGRDPWQTPAGALMALAILAAVLSTWLAGVSALHSHAER